MDIDLEPGAPIPKGRGVGRLNIDEETQLRKQITEMINRVTLGLENRDAAFGHWYEDLGWEDKDIDYSGLTTNQVDDESVERALYNCFINPPTWSLFEDIDGVDEGNIDIDGDLEIDGVGDLDDGMVYNENNDYLMTKVPPCQPSGLYEIIPYQLVFSAQYPSESRLGSECIYDNTGICSEEIYLATQNEKLKKKIKIKDCL